MQEYRIDVTKIEELQTVQDVDALDNLFAKAKSTIVNGEAVILFRTANGAKNEFDRLTTLEDLEAYRETVYKYL